MPTINIGNLENQEKILELLQIVYTSSFNTSKFDWGTFFGLRQTGELFGTKFQNQTVSDSGIGEFMYDSVGHVCVPSTDKEKKQDDFEHHNAFWYCLCNYEVDENGVKIPTAIEGQSTFKRVGDVDVGVLTPPLYWGEETVEGGYVRLFSDAEHPVKRPELTLTLMPHCRDNKGNPMPYGIVPVYYAGRGTDKKLHGSSGLPVENFMSYTKLHQEMTTLGPGYVGAGSERSAYLKNFLWIKYKTLNSQSVFQGCTSYSAQGLNQKAESNVNYVTISKTQGAAFYVGGTVSIGTPNTGADTPTDRGHASMRSIADKVRVTKIEDADATNYKIYVDGPAFTTTANTYISTMPLHSGQTDNVLGNDGYVVNDGKHSFRIQGVEEGIGAYMVSGNEIFNKETGTKTVIYNRNGKDYQTTDFSTWKVAGEFSKADGNDIWIGEEKVDFETGSTLIKTIGSGSGKGVGDYIYWGGANIGLREHLSRGNLWPGSLSGLSCLNVWSGLSGAFWDFAAAVS